MADPVTSVSNAGVPGATPQPAAAPAAAPAPASVPSPSEPAAPSASVVAAGPAAAPATAPSPAPAPTPATWNDNWRDLMANGDAKELERLTRFSTPADVYKSYRAIEQMRSSGALKEALPAGATPEQVAEYRKANGIPEDPMGYLKDLPGGYIVGEEDKALLGDFAKYMHETNAPTPVVQRAAEWYFKFAEKQAQEDAAKAGAFARESMNTLRADWGKDFEENQNRAGTLLGMFPEALHPLLNGAKLADGTLMLDHPDVAKTLAQIHRELDPAYTLAGAMGGSQSGGLNEEIAAIEKLIPNRGSEYWRGPGAEKMQDRYRELLRAKQNLAERGRAA